MSKLRMAGQIGKLLKSILIPRNQAGKIATGELAARYAPDLLYAGLTATQLPQGATGMERAGVAAEDLGIGLLASLGGQVLGGGGARLAGKRLGRDAQNLAATVGDVVIQAPVNMLAPRPVFEGSINRIYGDQEQQQVAQAETEMSEAQLEQDIINLLLQGGYAAGRAVT